MKHDEMEMRKTDAPAPKSTTELAAYVEKLIGGEHDYGTCVYAMSLAAVAAYNLVASKLGVTGFQASCADMDILRRTRGMDRFCITNADNVLYPQYDLVGDVREYLNKVLSSEEMRAEARKRLKNAKGVNPEVVAHWKKVADGRVKV